MYGNSFRCLDLHIGWHFSEAYGNDFQVGGKTGARLTHDEHEDISRGNHEATFSPSSASPLEAYDACSNLVASKLAIPLLPPFLMTCHVIIQRLLSSESQGLIQPRMCSERNVGISNLIEGSLGLAFVSKHLA